MLTKEQEEQIEQMFALKRSRDKEYKLLGLAFLKALKIDKMYVQTCRMHNPDRYTGVFLKKLTEIDSPKAVILVLNNLNKTSGYINYPGGNSIKFPILKVYES